MLDPAFGGFLAIASLIIGILMLTGHGDLFLRNGKSGNQTANVYDMEKMSKVSGAMLIVFAVLTGIDCFTTSAAAKMAYLVGIIAAFGVYIFLVRTRCKK